MGMLQKGFGYSVKKFIKTEGSNIFYTTVIISAVIGYMALILFMVENW